jgi:hypothetical protein
VLLTTGEIVGGQRYNPNLVGVTLKTWEKTAFESGVGRPKWDWVPSQTPGADVPGIEGENYLPN